MDFSKDSCEKRNFQEHVFVAEVTAFVKNFTIRILCKWRTISRFSNKLWINPTRLVAYSMVIVDEPTERGEKIFLKKSYINAITSFRKYREWNFWNERNIQENLINSYSIEISENSVPWIASIFLTEFISTLNLNKNFCFTTGKFKFDTYSAQTPFKCYSRAGAAKIDVFLSTNHYIN